MIKIHEDVKKVLLTEEEIAKRVKELGAEISKDYEGKEIVMVCLLTGAAWFATDLSRALENDMRMDFMVASSYGNGTTTAGNVKVSLDVRTDLSNKHVLLVDDIIDTGTTFKAITDMLASRNVASIKTCALCDKKERRTADINADYVGFVIPDEFVVGYGLDFAGSYRNLPYIGVLKSSVYAKV
mgnify:FL=1